MSDICQTCGLPKDLCVCETIAKESQEIRIYTVKKKFGKLNTAIVGLDEKDLNIKDVLKTLKSKLACGGSYKGGIIELQGNHKQKVKSVLLEMGFPESTISVK